jgi:hypothetical protein
MGKKKESKNADDEGEEAAEQAKVTAMQAGFKGGRRAPTPPPEESSDGEEHEAGSYGALLKEFHRMDRIHAGALSPEEANEAYSNAGCDDIKVKEKGITEVDLINFMKRAGMETEHAKKQRMQYNALVSKFKKADTDTDGLISAEDQQVCYQAVGLKRVRVDPHGEPVDIVKYMQTAGFGEIHRRDVALKQEKKAEADANKAAAAEQEAPPPPDIDESYTGRSFSDEEVGKAARSGNLELLRALVATEPRQKRLAKLLNRCGYEGRPPLYWAALYGHTTIMTFLLAKGAAVDKAGSGGLTPLMGAAYGHQIEALQLLVDSKARLHHRDHRGQSAYAHAVKKNPLWKSLSEDEQDDIEGLLDEDRSSVCVVS